MALHWRSSGSCSLHLLEKMTTSILTDTYRIAVTIEAEYMKIHFTKKEYDHLLDMIYISDWVMHSHCNSTPNNGYTDLRKKLLSIYNTMGAEAKVEYDNESGEFFETLSHETAMHEKYLDPYDEETFWDALIDRLATRDFIETVGVDAYETMSGGDRLIGVENEKEKYVSEFEKAGLQNIKVNDITRH